MKLKQYLILGIGMIAGFGLSLAGLSYASNGGSNNVNLITKEKAKTIMLNKVPGAAITEFSYDKDDRVPKYDGTLVKENYEYEIDVNAKTGEVIKFEKEKIFTSNNSSNSNGSNNSSINNQQSTTKPNSTQNNTNSNKVTSTQGNSYIREAKAKSIMLSKVPGATIKQFYLDNDRTPEYEAELIKGDIEYEISIDARTGEIKEFSKEHIEKYDDDRYDDDRYDD